MSLEKPDDHLRRLSDEGDDPRLEVFDLADAPGPTRRRFLAALALIVEEFRSTALAAPPDPSDEVGKDKGDAKKSPDTKGGKDRAPPKPAAGWGNQWLIAAHRGPVSAVAVSTNGKLLATGSLDRSVKVWEMPGGLLRKWWPDGRQVKSLPAKGGDVRAVYVPAMQETAAVLIKESEVQLFSLPPDKRLPPIDGTRKFAGPAAISCDGKILVAVTETDQIQFWDTTERKLIGEIECPATAVALSHDGRLAARGGREGQLQLWNVASGEMQFQHNANRAPVSAIATIANPLTIAWAQQNSVFVKTVGDDQDARQLKGQHRYQVTALALTQDGRYVVSGDRDGVVVIWDLAEEEAIAYLFDPTISAGDATAFQIPVEGSNTPVLFTLPCGSPTPPGATCVCNCVPGVATRIAIEQQNIQRQLELQERLRWEMYRSMMNAGVNSRRSSSTTCTCNTVCTCNLVYR